MKLSDLNKCMGMLATLNSSGLGFAQRELVVNIGCMIQEEINAITNSKNADNKLDAEKLMADNRQLFEENQKLAKAVVQLKQIIHENMPNILNKLSALNGNIGKINKQINDL